jgi:hypothetical protein
MPNTHELQKAWNDPVRTKSRSRPREPGSQRQCCDAAATSAGARLGLKVRTRASSQGRKVASLSGSTPRMAPMQATGTARPASQSGRIQSGLGAGPVQFGEARAGGAPRIRAGGGELEDEKRTGPAVGHQALPAFGQPRVQTTQDGPAGRSGCDKESPAAQGVAGPGLVQSRCRLQNVQHLRHEGVADDVSLGEADDADVAAHAFDAVGDGGET